MALSVPTKGSLRSWERFGLSAPKSRLRIPTAGRKLIRFPALVAPYCAILRDYLSDTPLLRAMGFLVSQHGQLGAIPPPPFLSISPLESMQSGGAIPPPQKGYLSDTCAIPYENKANGCDTPLCETISKGYCAIWGVSRTGPLSFRHTHIKESETVAASRVAAIVPCRR